MRAGAKEIFFKLVQPLGYFKILSTWKWFKKIPPILLDAVVDLSGI